METLPSLSWALSQPSSSNLHISPTPVYLPFKLRGKLWVQQDQSFVQSNSGKRFGWAVVNPR